MTISNNVVSLIAAQKYFEQFIALKDQEFNDTLTEDVRCKHTRMIDGIPGETVELQGKSAVSEAYRKHFFEITNNLDPRKTVFTANNLKADIHCEVEEDKNEEGMVHRYLMISDIELCFQRTDNEMKIVQIWEKTSKTLIH